MVRRRVLLVPLLTALLGALPLAACGGADFVYFESITSGPNPGSTLIVVWMSDSPADDAEALEVSVARVELVRGAEVTALMTSRQTHDLLSLQHGVRAKLAETEVAPADYDRIRVTLVATGAFAPRVRRAGVWEPLPFIDPGAHVIDVPYANQADADQTIEVQIDFNARTSLIEGPGGLALDPRLDALDPGTAGTIQGVVETDLGVVVPGAIVVAWRGGVEVRSARTRADGTYALTPLAPGLYDIEVVGAPGPVLPHLDLALAPTVTRTIDFTVN